MAAVSTSNRGGARGVARGRQPVMHRSSNSPTLERRLAPTLMTGDQQYHSVAGAYCAIQPLVDCLPGLIETVAMKVEDPIRFNPPRAKPAVPTAVKRGVLKALAWRWHWVGPSWLGDPPLWHGCDGSRQWWWCGNIEWIAR
jgi:hypothetical protein